MIMKLLIVQLFSNHLYSFLLAAIVRIYWIAPYKYVFGLQCHSNLVLFHCRGFLKPL